jgi:hypothetical protein
MNPEIEKLRELIDLHNLPKKREYLIVDGEVYAFRTNDPDCEEVYKVLYR